MADCELDSVPKLEQRPTITDVVSKEDNEDTFSIYWMLGLTYLKGCDAGSRR